MLADAASRPPSKHSSAVALAGKGVARPALASLLRWTMRRADCVASAIGRLGGSSRARQRLVNSCPRSARLG